MATLKQHVDRRIEEFRGLFRRSIVTEEGDRHYKVSFALRKPVLVQHLKPVYKEFMRRKIGRIRLHQPLSRSNKVEYFGERRASSHHPSWTFENFGNNAVVTVSKTDASLRDAAVLSIFLRRLAALFPKQKKRRAK